MFAALTSLRFKSPALRLLRMHGTHQPYSRRYYISLTTLTRYYISLHTFTSLPKDTCSQAIIADGKDYKTDFFEERFDAKQTTYSTGDTFDFHYGCSERRFRLFGFARPSAHSIIIPKYDSRARNSTGRSFTTLFFRKDYCRRV